MRVGLECDEPLLMQAQMTEKRADTPAARPHRRSALLPLGARPDLRGELADRRPFAREALGRKREFSNSLPT